MGANANVLEGRPPSKPARYLREHRLRITFWTAAIEGLLVIVGVIPHLAVYVLAVAAILFWVFMARNYRSATARNLSWIFAASQALVVLVPVLWFVAKWIAILAIAVIAIGALVVLFADRPHA